MKCILGDSFARPTSICARAPTDGNKAACTMHHLPAYRSSYGHSSRASLLALILVRHTLMGMLLRQTSGCGRMDYMAYRVRS